MRRAPQELRASVLLSLQQALLGEITPEMRMIAVEHSAEEIRVRVYVEGPIREEVRDDFDAGAMTQVAAAFPYTDRGDPRVCLEFIRFDPPEHPFIQGALVYCRKEERHEF